MGKITKKRTRPLDSFSRRPETLEPDILLARFVTKHKNKPFVFSRHGKSGDPRVIDSRPLNRRSFMQAGVDGIFWESPLRRDLLVVEFKEDKLYQELRNRYFDVWNYWKDLWRDSTRGVSLVRAWNMSIVASIFFGMILMTMIYRYLGQGAASREESTSVQTAQEMQLAQNSAGAVLGESAENPESGPDKDSAEYTAQLVEDYAKKEQDEFEAEIREMVKGYPIEEMVPYIAKKDRVVAAFLVGIARKESSWGVHVPVLNGQDCYNYWGYRGKRKRMGTGGHTCFDSPEDAVDTVAKRIEFLVKNEKLNTPSKMVVAWKCGYDCSWDDPAAVKKWVSDVNLYFKKFDK